jgi:hypothetical protein
VNNKWIGCKNSPGLYARNRYGKNVFKRAISWRYLGLANSFENYSRKKVPSSNDCPTIGHHSCLVNLKSDGNTQFFDI